MKKYLFLPCLFLAFNAFATHNHAGEILIEQTDALTIRVSVITYTLDQFSAADRPSLTVYWGDGTSQVVNRFGVGQKLVDSGYKQNVYESTHTFSRKGKYTVYMTDPNRNTGILNVNFPYSDLVPFHLQATITLVDIRANGKYNTTPKLRRYPIEVATVGSLFRRTPDAIDDDGDSMVFKLITPRQGLHKDIDGYLLPSAILPSDSNSISFDSRNGSFTWNKPQKIGLYNIAIQVVSYRDGVAIDTIMRDMDIIVQSLSSVQFVDSQLFVKLSPNPIYTEGLMSIDNSFGQNTHLEIVNALGQTVEMAVLRNEQYYAIQRKNWASGLYFIHLKSETRQTVLKMQVVE
jgi:Secretion system C-terminal sorting domain